MAWILIDLGYSIFIEFSTFFRIKDNIIIILA